MPKNTASSQPISKHQEFLVGVEVAGADLIMHKFSQKSVEEMLRKHMGFTTEREPKRPRDLIERAVIRNTEDAICMPSICFKMAMLDASLPISGLITKRLKGQIWVQGGSIPIEYEKMIPRMDVVRLPNGNPDVRFRPMFINWKARMLIGYNEALQVETIIDLLQRSGKLGVGEWRPSRNGTFGMFKVTRNITSKKELEEVREQCEPQVQPLVIPDWAMDVEIDDELMSKIANSSDPGDQIEASNKTTKKTTTEKKAVA